MKGEENSLKFRVRYFSELAQKYFPDSTPKSAVQQLKRWIKMNLKLQTRLEELNFGPYQRSLTPLQCDAIIEAFGEP